MARTRSRDLLMAQKGELLSSYLDGLPAARRGARRRLPARDLDGGQRLRIVDTLLCVIEGAYCHLPQKRAAYAQDPVQALRLLRIRAAELSEREFHLALIGIVTGLRDAHTLYSGPESALGSVATLPFLVEQYGPVDAPTYVVSKVSAPALVKDRHFIAGAVLDSWNGIPFDRAVDVYADWETGGRPDARRARALESLTFRSLEYNAPPDERWVILEYHVPPDRSRREIRLPWRVVRPQRASTGHEPGSRAARFLGMDPSGEQVRRAKKLLFSGELWQAEQGGRAMAKKKDWIPTRMQDVLAAKEVDCQGLGRIGYLRIWTFDVADDDAFLAELIRLLELLPQEGLIIDLRGNPGGLIWAAERALQLLTPRRIVPTRFSLLATPLTRAMAQSPFNRLELGAWLPSLESAISSGESYSQPLPLTEPEWCNDLGQHYGGPVVCVVDPNTYSSGDLFAAGFVDNEIGTLVSIGQATGAGGANVWDHHDLFEALAETSCKLERLPPGVGYTLAIRRAVRSAGSDGLPIEDFGVAGVPYAMTQADLIDDNRDLIDFCGQFLCGAVQTQMQVTLTKKSVSVETRGLDELEAYLDDRPLETVRAIPDGSLTLTRPSGALLEFVGRRQGQICQRRRVVLARA